MRLPNRDYSSPIELLNSSWTPQKIDLSGFNELVTEYGDMQENDPATAYDLSQRALAWADYLSDMLAACTKYYNNAETDKKATRARSSIMADDKTVARGDRYADQDDAVVAARKKRNEGEAYIRLLEPKVEHCRSIHYHSRQIWEHGLPVQSKSSRV
jgi:hypothetical protein